MVDVFSYALSVDAHSDSAWLRYLAELGALAALRPLDPPRRVLLGLPTGDLAAAALAGSAVGAVASHCANHPRDVLTPADVACRVSTFQSGGYEDAQLGGVERGVIRVGNVKHTIYADVVRRVPDDFVVDRGRRILREPTATAWNSVARCGVDGRRLHARVSATPVVVIGHRTALADSFADLETVSPKISQLADVGHATDL